MVPNDDSDQCVPDDGGGGMVDIYWCLVMMLMMIVVVLSNGDATRVISCLVCGSTASLSDDRFSLTRGFVMDVLVNSAQHLFNFHLDRLVWVIKWDVRNNQYCLPTRSEPRAAPTSVLRLSLQGS